MTSATPPKKTAAIRSAFAANYVDQFDIFVPVIALAPVTGQLFGADNLVQTAGLVFVATLIGRPLGALIFGPIADKIGRTRVSIVTLAGISITSYGIALTADFQSWGIWALYWVIAMRFLGGVFLGGQYSAAIPLAMEWSRPRLRGLISGGIMAMSPLANASIAALTLVLLGTLGEDSYAQWGWRIPFVIAATLALALMVIYWTTVSDSAPLRQGVLPAATRHSAIKHVTVGSFRRTFFSVFLLMSGLWLLTNMAIPVVTQQLTASGRWDAAQVTLVMLCGTGASAISMLLCGHLSTLMGRRRFFLVAGVLIACVAPFSYSRLISAQSIEEVAVYVIVLQVFTVSAYGPVGAFLSEQFPPNVRSTGYGLGYSLSIVLPALYPYYLPHLQRMTSEYGAVAGLIILGGICVIAGSAFSGRADTLKEVLQGSQEPRSRTQAEPTTLGLRASTTS